MPYPSVPHIIPVLSGKGGVGKSSVTVQLALSLSLSGHSVGVLDIDLTGPSIPRLFGIENEKVRQAPGGWLPVTVNPSFHSTELDSQIGSIYCMSLGFLLRSRGDAVIWRGPKKTAMVGQLLSEVLWPQDVEYLLIDTPPGTSDEHISLVSNLLDPNKFPNVASAPAGPAMDGGEQASTTRATALGAVIVTTPQAISTADVKKELTFCRKVGLKVLGVIENMAGYVCPCCGETTDVFSKGGGEVMAMEWGVKFLGRVPIDGEGWGMLVEEGKRPTYTSSAAQASSNGGSDLDTQKDNEQQETSLATNGADDARMVEKYKSCSLASKFAEVVEKLHDNEGTLPQQPAT